MPFEAAALDAGEAESITESSELRTDDTLLRIAGKDRYETSRLIAEAWKEEWDGKLPNVILACGTDYPDALGAATAISWKCSPIILVDKNKIKETAEYVAANLMDVQIYEGVSCGRVYIMGGNGAVPETMETELVAAGIDPSRVIRFAGKDRYETNLKMLMEFGWPGSNSYVMVCSGKSYADALSASGTGGKILLVGDELTDEQRQLIKGKQWSNFAIIGGTAAVNEDVEAEIREIAEGQGGTVERLGGKNRFETSKEVAKYFWKYVHTDWVVLTYGMNFPDGLCGALWCQDAEAPLLLATNTFTGDAKEAAQILGATHVCVLGGESLISDEAALSVLDY